jgi:hypothetical protein
VVVADTADVVVCVVVVAICVGVVVVVDDVFVVVVGGTKTNPLTVAAPLAVVMLIAPEFPFPTTAMI